MLKEKQIIHIICFLILVQEVHTVKNSKFEIEKVVKDLILQVKIELERQKVIYVVSSKGICNFIFCVR